MAHRLLFARRTAGAVLTAALIHVAACTALPRPGRVHESGAWTAGTATHALKVGSDDRGYLLHIPARQPRSRIGLRRGYPVVLVLHGSSGSAASAQRASRMDSIADARGFLAVYPVGTKGPLGLYRSDWNAGACCGMAARDQVDDVAFLRRVIEQLGEHLPIDRERIYVTGFSDGGRMAYRAACELAPLIAAIGVVSGSLLTPGCSPAVPVPVIAFHGTADTEVSYSDTALAAPPASLPDWAKAYPSTIGFWIARNDCRAATVRQLSPHVSRTVFAPCSGSADVALYTIDQGVHGWPGEPEGGAGALPPMSELHASDVMVRFLFRHVRSQPH